MYTFLALFSVMVDHSTNIGGALLQSADGVPFVGELPGLPGQWICAGHHGQ